MRYLMKRDHLLISLFIIFIFSVTAVGCGIKSGSKVSVNEPSTSTSDSITEIKPMDEAAAMNILTAALGNKLQGGLALVSSGKSNVNGQPCWSFGLDSNAKDKFTINEHYAVTEDGMVYLYDIISNEHIIYSMGNKHLMPLLRIDTSGMEEVSNDTEYILDDVVYVGLLTYYSSVNDKDYNSHTMLSRIKVLQGDDIRITSLASSGEPNKEYSGGLGYPTWNIIYEKGENEDTAYCMDLYFRTSFGEYYVHTSIPIDYKEKYQKEIQRRMETTALVSPLTINTVGMTVASPLETEYWFDGSLYMRLQSLAPLYKSIDENAVLSRIKELEEEDIRVISLTKAEEQSQRLTHPTYLIVYETGRNEDTSHCTDLYFCTDSGEYRVHTSVSADLVEEYRDEIRQRLATVGYDTYYTNMRYQ